MIRRQTFRQQLLNYASIYGLLGPQAQVTLATSSRWFQRVPWAAVPETRAPDKCISSRLGDTCEWEGGSQRAPKWQPQPGCATLVHLARAPPVSNQEPVPQPKARGQVEGGVAACQELALGLLWFPWTQGCKHPRPPEPDSQGSSSGPQLKDRHQVHLTTPIRETPALWKAAEDGACPQSSLERITVSSYTCV